MRRPWLRDWSCGATRQLCKMAGSKNIGESAGTTVRIVRRTQTPKGFRRTMVLAHRHNVRRHRPKSGSVSPSRPWRPSLLRAPGDR